MSAFKKAQELLEEANNLIVSERERERRLHLAYDEAWGKAEAELVAGGAQVTDKGFHLRVADKVWEAADRIRRCQENIKRFEDRQLTLREVLCGQVN